jgi:hypothetical protein
VIIQLSFFSTEFPAYTASSHSIQRCVYGVVPFYIVLCSIHPGLWSWSQINVTVLSLKEDGITPMTATSNNEDDL